MALAEAVLRVAAAEYCSVLQQKTLKILVTAPLPAIAFWELLLIDRLNFYQ